MSSRLLATIAALALGGCAMPRTAVVAPPAPALVTDRFGAPPGPRARTLFVVLHGDAGAAAPTRHREAARLLAAALPGSAAIALYRPGHVDDSGRRSPGDAGEAGDSYDPARLAATADALATLRAQYPNARTIVVGHSGGAAVVANIAGTRARLIDAMVLVGCPCMLDEFRVANGLKGRPKSLDPLRTTGGVAPGTRAVLIVGGSDTVTPPELSRGYAEALALRGVATDLRILPGKGHEILTDPEVIAVATALSPPSDRQP